MFDDLIDDIYRAGFERERWGGLMGRIGHFVGSERAYFHSPAVAGAPEDALRRYVTLNLDNDWLDTYYYHYAPQDPFSYKMLEQVGFDHRKVLGLLRSRPDDAALKSEYYADYCHTMGIGDVMTLMLEAPSARYTPPTIGFAGKWGAGPMSTEQIEKFQAIAPHLQRVGRLMFDVHAIDPGLKASIDLLPHSVFLLRENGSIICANARGEQALGSQFGISVRGGMFAAMRSRDDARLQQILARVTRATMSAPRMGGEMDIEGLDGASATLIAMPLGADNPFREQTGPCRAIVYIMPHFEALEFPGRGRLARLYGLTSAEVDVTFALISGMSPEEIAVDRGRSMNTVRTQIRIILSKTGHNRIADLRALMRLIELPMA